MKSTDPARMSREDIMAELGEILAAGAQRRIASSIGRSGESSNPPNALDETADSMLHVGNPRRSEHEHPRRD